MGNDSIQPSYFQIKEFLDEIEQEATAQTFANLIENPNFKKPHKHITEISAEQIKEVDVLMEIVIFLLELKSYHLENMTKNLYPNVIIVLRILRIVAKNKKIKIYFLS